MLTKFSQLLKMHTKIESKIGTRTLLKKKNYLLKFSKLHFLLKLLFKKFRYPEPVKIGSTTLATGLNYLPDPLLAA